MTSEQYDKLTDEEKRIKVAELCGFEFRLGSPDPSRWYCRAYGNDGMFFRMPGGDSWGCGRCQFSEYVPDYPNDLNAMHEAELTRIWCGGGDREKRIIDYLSLLDVFTLDSEYTAQSATAAQRAKAFVLTMTEGEGKP